MIEIVGEGKPVVRFALNDGAYLPERAHTFDAGVDLRTPRDFTLPGYASAIIDTGVHVEIPEGYVGMLKSKSGLNVKHDIVSEGVIDAGYTGRIVVKLYNNSSFDKEFKRGDKITQLVIMPCMLYDVQEVKLDEIKGGERGDNGFGSTGK